MESTWYCLLRADRVTALWAMVRAVSFSHEQNSSSSSKSPLHWFRWFTWSCLAPIGPSLTPALDEFGQL